MPSGIQKPANDVLEPKHPQEARTSTTNLIPTYPGILTLEIWHFWLVIGLSHACCREYLVAWRLCNPVAMVTQ